MTRVRIVAANGNVVRAEFGGGVDGLLRPDALVANRPTLTAWGLFRRHERPDGTFSLQCFDQHYVTAESGGGGAVSTTRSIAGPYEGFRDVDGRLQCADGTHYLRLRQDGIEPVLDAAGLADRDGAALRFQVLTVAKKDDE